MNEIEQIRSRINSESNRINAPIKEKRILKFFNIIFCLLLIVMGALIYCKVDENATLFNSLFKTNISFVDMNQTIRSYIDKLFFLKNDVNEEDNQEMVSNEIMYIEIGNNKYQTSDQNIQMIKNGEIISMSYQNEYEYFVVIDYEDNITALYTFIDEVNVSVGQTLSKNDILGSYEGEYFNCIFKKGEQIITYNEATK